MLAISVTVSEAVLVRGFDWQYNTGLERLGS